MSNTYIFDAEGVAGSLSDFGDFRNLGGGGTVKFTADGYHIQTAVSFFSKPFGRSLSMGQSVLTMTPV